MTRPLAVTIAICLTGIFLMTCTRKPARSTDSTAALQVDDHTYRDTVFWQEFHEAFPVIKKSSPLSVRTVAVGDDGTVWITTAQGAFKKSADSREWIDAVPVAEQGPSFSVVKAIDGAIWMSTWNKVYRTQEGTLNEVAGLQSPVGVLATAREGIYALGPKGAWLWKDGARALSYTVAKSVRAAHSDGQGGLWVGSDVGIYHGRGDSVTHTHDTTDILSAYVRGIAVDRRGNFWFGGLGGVTVLKPSGETIKLRPENGIPSIQVNCVELAPDGSIWIGTDVGIVRYRGFDKHTLLFSRRWLLDDRVTDIAFDQEGTAWVATDGGVSAIRRKSMTLLSKQNYFYDVLMRRHIRDPWIAGQCKLPLAGDTTKWEGDDDDNDGEYTSNYLAMESFRYATTGEADAKIKAKKAFGFLKLLQEVTETDGFFARTVVPASWTAIDDGNRTFTERELADELVKEPRFKPVEVRWRKSRDGKWLWKGDTSSDEICGHMMGYFFYHELVADETEKPVVAAHVAKIVDHLIRNNYTLTDIDGTHTRWGVWSPDKLNRDAEWQPDRSLNSMELLAFLKLAYHVTMDEKYQLEYKRLIDEEHYLDNMANISRQNPGWLIYFDVILAAYQYPILLKCEKDPELLKFYEAHIDDWIERRKGDANPLVNFIYTYSRGRKAEVQPSVDFLIDTPLDLIDWKIDHTKREDVQLVRSPVLDEIQVSDLPPASIRSTVRWDKNPWSLNSGNPNLEREPVFWLLPYWMGRYLKTIE
jgi:streptogramin lyase